MIKLLGHCSLFSESFLCELEHLLSRPVPFRVRLLEAIEALLEGSHVLRFDSGVKGFGCRVGACVILRVAHPATIVVAIVAIVFADVVIALFKATTAAPQVAAAP